MDVYDFVYRNDLSVCIFSVWTRASLNFGELNLYLPPQLPKTTTNKKKSKLMRENEAHQG